MNIIRKRFSRQDLIQLFVFFAFPIHVWSIVYELREVPSLMLSMTSGEIVGSLAYNMLFTLIESALMFLLVLVVGILLPSRWTQTTFVPVTSVLLIELAFMMMFFQWLTYRSFPRLLFGLICLLLLVLTALAVPRYPRLHHIIRTVAECLTVLTGLYLLIDVVGVIIVIARNV